MAAETLSIGLIGAGRIGQLHARHMTRRVGRAELLAVADISEDAARSCAETYGIPSYYRDYGALLDRADIEAVVIASPTPTHAPVIEAAAGARKHIFCEKPISLEPAVILRLLEQVEETDIKLQVGFNRRFDANYQRVYRAIRGGEIGTPHTMRLVSRDPSPPSIDYIRQSGGLFLDMTIHDFDMARFLIGSEVSEVYVRADVKVDPAIGEAGDVDTAVTVLTFENGVIGTIDNSRQAVYGYDQRVEVFGSEGSIETDNNYDNAATIRGAQWVKRDLPQNFFIERYIESYVRELEMFVSSVIDSTPPEVSGWDGYWPVVMGRAARQSHEQNRPIDLDEVHPPQFSAFL